MKKMKTALVTSLCSTALFSPAVFSLDQDLLDTLFKNGVLNKEQYYNLTKKTEEKIKENAFAAAEKSAKEKEDSKDWTSRVKVSGDMRFRQEFRDSDTKGSEKNQTRIRARIGVAAEVNDTVDVGVRLVTAGGTTSTNQTLEGGFRKKFIYRPCFYQMESQHYSWSYFNCWKNKTTLVQRF